MIPTIFSVARRGQMLARGLLGDEDGAAAVVIAVALTRVVGLAGLATEGANWYFTSRRMQSAADAAAYSAATSLGSNENSTDFTAEGKWVAASPTDASGNPLPPPKSYGFTSSNATVTVNNPPTSGSHSANSSAVEVIIAQPQTRMISSLFLASAPTSCPASVTPGCIRARAVALVTPNNNGCVLALDRGNVIDTSDTGGGTINLTNCNMYINSDDPTGALTMSGSTTINTSGVSVTGGISMGGGSTLNITPPPGSNAPSTPLTGVAPINDPYKGVSVPTWSACDVTGGYSGTPATIGTGGVNGSGIYVICGGIHLGAHANVTLASNTTYIIAGGSFYVDGQATLSGTNVTIVLTDYNGSYATMDIRAGATVTLSAPTDTTNPLHGLAFFQDPSAPTSVQNSNSMTCGANQSITGALYFPTESLKFAGNTSGSSTCTQLVVNQLTFTGATTIGSNCTGVAIDHFGSSTAQLVE
jgi:Flp pilus assembly protein TadG